jgi:hypothetical protein
MIKKQQPILDLSVRLHHLGTHLCRSLPGLRHIQPERVLFCMSRSRADGSHGVYARIVPLRFSGGEQECTRRRGRYLETYRMPSLIHQGREIFYLIYVMVPRFFRLPFEQKLHTVVHELYHISERCDGDIRRFNGRNFAHGSSRKGYDRQIAEMTRHDLEGLPEADLLDCLHRGEEEWQRQAFRLTGLQVPLPRIRLVNRCRA